ncbi:MAG TPA: PA14 domain-containing protein, partial [Anaerolineae bacterium]|nr:PA14 domain-containing protein [Anaerolineae bacterium]
SFSARWSGSIEAPHDGTYLFRVHADDGVRLWLDGEVVGEGLNPDNVNMAECSVHLSAGRHAIQVDYFQRGGGKALEMWWTVPGGKHQVVPPSALWPE